MYRPRIGVPRHLGFLGQTAGFNAYANPVAGQQYVLNFSVSLGAGSPFTPQSLFQTALPNFALFQNGALTLINVTAVQSTVSVTVQANAGAASVTLGGIESGMADSVSSQSGVTVTPLDMAGGGTTTFSAQWAQSGGVVLNPITGLEMTTNWILGLPIQGPGGVVSNPLTNPASPISLPSLPTLPSIPAWLWWALAGLGGLVILKVVL